MKSVKHILAMVCSLALLFSLTSALAEATAPIPARFSPNDMAVSFVYAGATQDEAVAVFGEPLSSETETSAATGETEETWYYNGLTLVFSSDRKLIGADVTDAAFEGPRGVTIGLTLEDVATRFYLMNNAPAGSVLYTSGYVEALDAQLPPCGFIRLLEDGKLSAVYVAPAAPFGDDVLSDPTDFIYQQLATYTVNFGEDSTATDFSWYLGPWAE